MPKHVIQNRSSLFDCFNDFSNENGAQNRSQNRSKIDLGAPGPPGSLRGAPQGLPEASGEQCWNHFGSILDQCWASFGPSRRLLHITWGAPAEHAFHKTVDDNGYADLHCRRSRVRIPAGPSCDSSASSLCSLASSPLGGRRQEGVAPWISSRIKMRPPKFRSTNCK